MSESWVLTLTCADAVGIVAAVSGALAGVGDFILDSQQYADLETGRFFMRVVFAGSDARDAIAPVTERFAMDWSLVASDWRPRVVIAGRSARCGSIRWG